MSSNERQNQSADCPTAADTIREIHRLAWRSFIGRPIETGSSTLCGIAQDASAFLERLEAIDNAQS